MAIVFERTDGDYSRTRKVCSRDVRLIRECAAAKVSHAAIAGAWGLRVDHVHSIVRGDSWKGTQQERV